MVVAHDDVHIGRQAAVLMKRHRRIVTSVGGGVFREGRRRERIATRYGGGVSHRRSQQISRAAVKRVTRVGFECVARARWVDAGSVASSAQDATIWLAGPRVSGAIQRVCSAPG